MNLELLKKILGWVRPAHSAQEEAFVEWLESYISDLGFNPVRDGYGNVWVENESAVTLFTSHTDTCHSVKLTERMQKLAVDDELGLMVLADPQPGYVLGADCGTGVYIMLEMMKAGVRGSYVFYRAEEVGGLGSSWSAQNAAHRYAQYKHAVAFDRKDNCSVITYQGGARCCSEEFAEVLGGLLDLQADDGGTFTDTANLTELVSECTNLSVGYGLQHTSSEYQDLNFLTEFVPKLIAVDWSALPAERDPTVVESWYDRYGSDYYSDWYPQVKGAKSASSAQEPNEQDVWRAIDEIAMYGDSVAADLVYSNPELAIEVLLTLCEN